MDVHRELGSRFLEVVYQRALAIRMTELGIPFEREVPLEIVFHGQSIGVFRADFICHGSVVVELKALPRVGQEEIAQLGHYLTATGRSLGLLLNFGSASLQFIRVIGGKVVPLRHESDAGNLWDSRSREAKDPFVSVKSVAPASGSPANA